MGTRGVSGGPGVAVFDFDGTVIRGDSVTLLVLFAFRRRLISLGEFARACGRGILYMLRLLDETRSKAPSHAFLTRLTERERADFLREFVDELVSRARPGALDAMRAHRAKGDVVMLCSASCSIYMEGVAARLPVDALVCTRSDPLGGMSGVNCKGEEKVRRVRQWLAVNGNLNAVLTAGYGDSEGDRFLLSQCQKAVLVNARRGLIKRMPQAQRVTWREPGAQKIKE